MQQKNAHIDEESTRMKMENVNGNFVAIYTDRAYAPKELLPKIICTLMATDEK